MKKTDVYQLNQWEMSDRVRMEDFNADNARLEAALEGKTGRFQQLYQHRPKNGESSFGSHFGSKPWKDLECVIASCDLHETTFQSDDYIALSLLYRDLTYSPYLTRLTGGSFWVVLFPFHDETASVRGFATGSGSGTIFVDRPFRDLSGISVSCRRGSSVFGSELVNAVWTVYGLK